VISFPWQHKNPLLGTELGNAGLDALLALLVCELLGSVLEGLLLPLLLGLLGGIALGLLEGVGADGLVCLEVEILKTVSLDVVLDVALELGVEALFIVIGESLHVLSDVTAADVLLESLGVELLGLDVVTGETVLGVGDEDTTVGSTLHGAEDTGTSGSAGKANIEEGLEGAALAVLGLSGLGESELTIGLLNTSEVLVHAELLEGTAGDEQTGSVGSSPVGKTVLNPVGLKLVGVGRAENLVAGDLGAHDLHDDVAVGEANH